MKHITGTFLITSRENIFSPHDDSCKSMVLPRHLMPVPLIDGDRLEVAFSSRSGTVNAIRLLERNREVVVSVDNGGQLKPLHDIGVGSITVDGSKSFRHGEILLVGLTTPRRSNSVVSGKLLNRLNHCTNAQLESEVVLRAFNIPVTWSKQVLLQAHESVAEQSLKNAAAPRENLRDCCFVTIDGEDARDFDDAVYCCETDDGWQISVAIADVASYVHADSILDHEACRRGNSVYIPGRVVPMLPPVLSDEACSLRPHEDKLVLVCRFHLDPAGNIAHYEFSRAIIRSRARLTYAQVHRLHRTGRLSACHAGSSSGQIVRMLRAAFRACKMLLRCREKRGALDIDTSETMLLFDEAGNVRAIVPNIRSSAHRLIEEFMICANVCAASFLGAHDRRFIYRVHDGLKQASIDGLKAFLRQRGICFNSTDARGLAQVLQQAKKRDDAALIHTAVLHSLGRAIYQYENNGHYGLALEQYTHFTSPIRRYPDLLVHRAIHSVLDSASDAQYPEKDLEEMGMHCSMTEKRAEHAARDVESYLKCVYAERHIGKTFWGTITAVTSFGLFIQLSSIHIEGLLHVADLSSDFYVFDETQRRLTGKSKGKIYQQGGRIKVMLDRVNTDLRHINLVLPRTKENCSRHCSRHIAP